MKDKKIKQLTLLENATCIRMIDYQLQQCIPIQMNNQVSRLK